MTSTSDSKCRDQPISSTTKIAIIMVPNTSIVVTVCPSSTKSVDPQFSSTAKVAIIMVPNSSVVENVLLRQLSCLVH